MISIQPLYSVNSEGSLWGVGLLGNENIMKRFRG